MRLAVIVMLGALLGCGAEAKPNARVVTFPERQSPMPTQTAVPKSDPSGPKARPDFPFEPIDSGVSEEALDESY